MWLPVPVVAPSKRVPMMGAPGDPPRVPTPRWVDALMLCGVAGVAYGIMRAAAEWGASVQSATALNLPPVHLPYYAGLSTLRMALAYVLSLGFSLVYAHRRRQPRG